MIYNGKYPMALSEACRNISSHYRFHLKVRGGLPQRLGYVTLYFLFFAVFRWGDRHTRAIAWLRRLGLSGWTVDVVTPEGLRLRLNLLAAFDPLYSIIGERDYDRFEDAAPKPGQVVIDAGANVGVFTSLGARLVGPSGRVVAIEPHPDNFAQLSRNVSANGFEHVSLVQAAVDDHEGEGKLFVHSDNINHSLVRATGRSVPVRVRTIDAIARELGLERVDFLKIDTEGNVAGILRGAARTLKTRRPFIVFERDFAEESAGIREELEKAGYLSRDASAFTYAWPRERPAPAA